MRILIGAGLGIALLASASTAQPRDRLPAECRSEIRTLCASGGGRPQRGAFRACLKENVAQISESCRAEIKQRIEQRGGNRQRQPASEGGREIGYGADPQQKLDIWPAATSGKRPPLIVYVHGGGWSRGDKATGTGSKPAYYNGLGLAFASLNYRLVPKVKPDDQARDIATAIAALRAQSSVLGFDPDRIILMGHSAGAHLAALVATDTRYLAKADVPVSAIKGAVLLDGAGYDVPTQMADKRNRVAGIYDAAFGKDAAQQRALSPVAHVAGPNSANWLILHVDRRADAKAQSETLAGGLRANGARVAVKAVPGSTHMSVNQDAGIAGSFVAGEISAFIASL
jgi:arylformamidase